jgi:hypothetical protein
MELLAFLAKVDDLVVGLVLGAAIGFLAGPVLRSALVGREWTATRREAEVADRLLERLEAMDGDEPVGTDPDELLEHRDVHRGPVRWRPAR